MKAEDQTRVDWALPVLGDPSWHQYCGFGFRVDESQAILLACRHVSCMPVCIDTLSCPSVHVCEQVSMHAWLAGWLDGMGWVDGWLDGWLDGMGGWMDGWMDGCTGLHYSLSNVSHLLNRHPAPLLSSMTILSNSHSSNAVHSHSLFAHTLVTLCSSRVEATLRRSRKATAPNKKGPPR